MYEQHRPARTLARCLICLVTQASKAHELSHEMPFILTKLFIIITNMSDSKDSDIYIAKGKRER